MSTLSGSGSTFFNLCYADDAIDIYETLRAEFPQFRIFEQSLDNIGVIGKG